jgi:sugar lactone lactonase YvrE
MTIARLMQMARAGVPAGGGDVWTDPNLANASYDSVSFSVAGQEANPSGMTFSEEGDKLYITGTAGDDINQYDLSTAWDISTSSFTQAFLVQSQDNLPQDVFFGDGGSSMFVLGTQNDSVYKYALTTAYDVSSASFDSSFSLATENTTPSGVFFKPDGTKMYVVGQTSPQSVYEYSLGTAWVITTASFTQSFSVSAQEANPKNIFFSPNGDKFFLVGLTTNDAVYEYSLSTAWDISSSSYVRNFSVASQETSPTGLWFKSDGSKMYVVGITTDTIYQYSTA